jgi:hypothetical protein
MESVNHEQFMYKIKFTFPTPNATSWFKEGWKQFVKIN